MVFYPCREEANTACKKRIEAVANTLGLEGFARIDAFVHADTGEVSVGSNLCSEDPLEC